MKITTIQRSIIVTSLLLILCLFFTACTSENTTTKPDFLAVGILPDHDEKLMRSKYELLLDYIAEYSGIDYELVVPSSYEQLLEWFHTGKINFALFGGYTFVKAHQQYNAIPIALRDIDGEFSSVALINSQIQAKTMAETKGLKLAFGPHLSTSGHLMPRYFFKHENIIPEIFYSEVKYSGAHDKTAEWVRDGIVDIGVANSGIVHEMYLDGRLDRNNVSVIWESLPYPDYVWAINHGVEKNTRNKILDAFLSLTPEITEHKAILQAVGAGYYLPANADDFNILNIVISQLEDTNQLP